MLVRNTTELVTEITGKLRAEYDNLTDPYALVINNNLITILENAANTLFRFIDPSNQFDLFKLQNANNYIQHHILREVDKCAFALTNTPHDFEHPTDIKRYCNKFLAEKTFRSFIPNGHITIPGSAIYILYSENNSNQLMFQVNLDMTKLDKLDYTESQIIPSEALKAIKKINIEYTNYIAILDYFEQVLFNELPSLNAMYKVCPSIIKYVYSKTSDKMFQKIKPNKVDKRLKPPPDVIVALGRSKLRGN